MERRLGARFVVVSAASNNQSMKASPLTLGELLYADPAIACVSEKDWLALVSAIAAGEETALRVLLEKTHWLVFTYLMRLTSDRRLTEDLILEVFQSVWCDAPVFDNSNGPVLGWIMRKARSCALTDARSVEVSRRSPDRIVASLLDDPVQADTASRVVPKHSRLDVALEVLTVHEREAIEAVLINGLSYSEMAQGGESIGTIKGRIRSGLSKLRRSLQEQGDE